MKRLNHRFIVTLIAFSLVCFTAGTFVSKPNPQKVQKVDLTDEFIKASQASFQMNEARYLAFQLLTADQFKCLDYVLIHESHWNPLAKNPSTHARGIGQLLASTYRNIGMKYSTDPRSQLIATLAYISRWYGSAGPCGAKAHWVKFKWY
jgi:hypothetical protein